jgi:hypothetical protein
MIQNQNKFPKRNHEFPYLLKYVSYKKGLLKSLKSEDSKIRNLGVKTTIFDNTACFITTNWDEIFE